jgi:F0F1-type ATP synthase assembly protein I
VSVDSKPQPPRKLSDVQIASLIGQSGCLVVVLVLGALFGGIMLDRLLGTKPLFTLALVLASLPIGMFALYRFAMGAVAGSVPPPAAKDKRSDDDDNHNS